MTLNDHLITHKREEATTIQVRMAGRNLLAIALLEPHFHEVLGLFVRVVLLQVVDDSDVINVPAASRNEPMPVA